MRVLRCGLRVLYASEQPMSANGDSLSLELLNSTLYTAQTDSNVGVVIMMETV